MAIRVDDYIVKIFLAYVLCVRPPLLSIVCRLSLSQISGHQGKRDTS